MIETEVSETRIISTTKVSVSESILTFNNKDLSFMNNLNYNGVCIMRD